MLPLLLAGAFVFVWVCSYWCNSDLFSPIKVYLLTLFICFFDIFLTPYRLDICCIYLGLLFVPLALTCFESKVSPLFARIVQSRRNGRTPVARPLQKGRMVEIIWLLTIVPVASMTYLVAVFGGLSEYLSHIVVRALALQGLNTFSELAINLISLLTVMYFGVGLIKKRSVGWWACYGLHFAITLAILAMSGSRRYFLMPMVIMLSLYHYFRRPISIRHAGVVLLGLLVVASMIGVLRMGQRGGELLDRELNEYERESVTAHFKYGLVPLEVVLNSDIVHLHYGSTFIAALTNVIPRPLWPAKPDSAGLVITKDYLGNRWLGASNLNAGLLAESMMNFGIGIGLIFSFVSLTAAMAFIVNSYGRALTFLNRTDKSVHGVLYLVRYLHVSLAITGLITWETAIVALPLIINLSALWVIELLVRPMQSARLSQVMPKCV